MDKSKQDDRCSTETDRKPMRYALMLCLALMSVTTAVAEINGIPVIGGRYCSDWIKNQKNDYLKSVQENWVLGYLSGIMEGIQHNIFPDLDSKDYRHFYEAIFFSVDKSCRDDPFKSVKTAVDDLICSRITEQGGKCIPRNDGRKH